MFAFGLLRGILANTAIVFSGLGIMGLPQRLTLYEQLEKARGNRPLIVYVTSTRSGVDSKMLSDAIPELLDQLTSLPADAAGVDLLVVSRGGDPMTAWRVMTLLHSRVKSVAVLIPQVAYSAATMLAMGANEIIMHPHGNLGPVDPQIEVMEPGKPRQHFGYEDLVGFLEFAKKEVGLTQEEHVRKIFEMFCRQVGPIPVAVAARAALLTVTMGEKLLRLHMGNDDPSARTIAEKLSKSFFDHGYPVSRREAKEDIGLKVVDVSSEIYTLMWQIWSDIETELKIRKPFNPLFELLSSAAGETLLGGVRQSSAPPNLPTNIVQQLNQTIQVQPGARGTVPDLTPILEQLLRSQAPAINPIEFELIYSIMESRRWASHEKAKGKIIGCRMPDLNLRAHAVATGGGWDRVNIGQPQPSKT
jgi:hypothetical protein